MESSNDHRTGPWWRQPSLPDITILLILASCVATLPSGHDWGGDFSQYITNAINLVSGTRYTDSHYIMNQYAFVGPIAYPPVFPAMLAPVYALFGLNYTAMKLVVLFCLGAVLFLIKKNFERQLSPLNIALILALFSLTPEIWSFRGNINADIPFMVFCFLSLYLMHRCHPELDTHTAARQQMTTANYATFALLGLSMYLAYGTRELGMVLPLTFITYELIRLRKLTWGCVLAVTIFVVLAYLQSIFMRGDPTSSETRKLLAGLLIKEYNYNNHLSFISLDPALLFKQAMRYLEAVTSLTPGTPMPGVNLPTLPLIAVICLFAAIGFVHNLFKGISCFEIFCGGSFATLTLFQGYGGVRYLFPLIPFLFYYAFLGIQSVCHLLQWQRANLIIGLIAGACFIVDGLYISHNLRSNPYTLSTDEQAQELFSFIRQSTPENATIIFDKPRVLGLNTQRYAAAFPLRRTPEFIPRYMQVLKAEYLIVESIDFLHQVPLTTITDKHKLLQAMPERFDLLFSNEHFRVYRLLPAEPAVNAAGQS